MTVSNTEKSLRRRILARSLGENTPASVIQSAIDLLDNEFGDNPEIKYAQLIKRLRESFDHPAFESGNLLGRIMMVRNKPAEQIGPDPAEGRAVEGEAPKPKEAVPSSVKVEGRALVFNTLLGHITSAVAKRGAEVEASYRKHLLDAALQMSLSPDCGKRLVAWVKSKNEPSAIVGGTAELHQIINAAFVWMCCEFGPVFADKVLISSVNETEKLNEAFEFPPRDFL
jgi:uncharacterized protein YbbK (DUF523 family)